MEKSNPDLMGCLLNNLQSGLGVLNCDLKGLL